MNDIVKDRVKGGMIGFMVGDALGLPIAGMTEEEVKKSTGYITQYTSNFHHPFFYFLHKGQYGSNTRLMLIALESLIKNKTYNQIDFKKRLLEDALRSKKDFFYSRWLGKTITHALLEDKPINSESITCVYRAIPFALLFDDLDQIIDITERQSKITHSSSASLASSFFVSSFLFNLKNDNKDIRVMAKDILSKMIVRYKHIDLLSKNISMVLDNNILNLDKARTLLGTGSLAHQTIPLALYIFINYANNFREGVIAGANSYRVEKSGEDEGSRYMSYIEELLFTYGGNTDGIAGFFGAFFGVRYGYNAIPKHFLESLEDREKILNLVDKYFT